MEDITGKRQYRKRKTVDAFVPNAKAEGDDYAKPGDGQVSEVGTGTPAVDKRAIERRKIGAMGRMMAGHSFVIR